MMSDIYFCTFGRNKTSFLCLNSAWEFTQKYFAIPTMKRQLTYGDSYSGKRPQYSNKLPFDIITAKYFVVNGTQYKITGWKHAHSEPSRVVFTIQKGNINDFDVEIVFYDDGLYIFTSNRKESGFTRESGWETFKYRDIKFINYLKKEIKLSKWISALDNNAYFYPYTLDLDRYRDDKNVLYRMF